MEKQSLQEYRTAFVKNFSNEALTITEQRAIVGEDGTKGENLPLPTDYENAFLDYTQERSELIAELSNLYSVETKNIPFVFYYSNVVDDENLMKYIALDSETNILNFTQIANKVIRWNPERMAKNVLKQLSLKTIRDIEKAVVADDGSMAGFQGLPFAGSGTAGAYVENTDMKTVAAVSENDLLAVLKMVKFKNAKWIMNGSFFLDNIFPLMASSKLVSQDNNGKYYIGGHRVIIVDSTPDDVAHFADLSYFGGNLVYAFATSEDFLATTRRYRLATNLQMAPVVEYGAFAKLVVSAS